MGLTARTYPTTAAAAAAAVPGATFTHGWLCNDLAGDMVPVFGGLTLTASGSIIYGQAGPLGGADRCLEFTSPATHGCFDGGANFDIAGTDDLVVAWVGLWSDLPSSFGAMFGKVSATFTNGWSVSGTDGRSIELAAGPGGTNGCSVIGTSAFHVGAWHVGIAVIDRSTGKTRIGTQALGGVQAISATGTCGAASFSVADPFTVGRSNWVSCNDRFRFAALYIGNGPGAATGLSTNLGAALQVFSDLMAEQPVARSYAQMLLSLLPPGKLWRFVGSTLYSFALGCADELVRVHNRVQDFLIELDPSTADETLPDYERVLGLTAAATNDERRANIVGLLIRRQRFRPVDFQNALAALLAQAPADVVVLERSVAFCASIGDQREIYRFFIYRDPSLPGTAFIASAQSLVDSMQPLHTVGHVIESVSAKYDDPHSLYDRDLLGA